jgi:hypothetical protein
MVPLRPTPERFEIDGRFQLLPERVSDAWAHPVLLQGKLHLRYHDALWCYDVGLNGKREVRYGR